MGDRLKAFGNSMRAFAARHGALRTNIIAGLTVALIVAAVTWYYGKPSFRPYIAVVVSTGSIDFPIPEEFQRGFQAAFQRAGVLESRDGRKINIEYPQDFGSVDEARRIAKELV